MDDIPLSTMNIVVSGIMGMLGGAIGILISAIVNWFLKDRELLKRDKLEEISRLRGRLLDHQLEMKDKALSDKDALEAKIEMLTNRLNNLEDR